MVVGIFMIIVVVLAPKYVHGQELPPAESVKNKTGVFKQSILNSAKYCSSIYETSTMSVLALLMSDSSSDRNAKCFLNCMLQRYRLMDKKGNYNRDKFPAFLGYIPDSKFLQTIKKNLSMCLREKDSDPCEMAYKFIECFYVGAKNKNDLQTTRDIVAAEGF